MTAATVDHKGKTIKYDEADDVWRCTELEISDAKLSTVKNRIDNFSRSERRVDVDVLKIENSRWSDEKSGSKKVRVTVLCEPERRHGDDKGQTRECWVTGGNRERAKVYINELVPVEAKPELDAWIALDRAAKKAQGEADTALAKIKRHTAESLAALGKNQNG